MTVDEFIDYSVEHELDVIILHNEVLCINNIYDFEIGHRYITFIYSYINSNATYTCITNTRPLRYYNYEPIAHFFEIISEEDIIKELISNNIDKELHDTIFKQ